MAWTYFIYLAFTLVGAFAFKRVFSISFSKKQIFSIILSLIATTIVFTLWDAWAVWRGHWQFGLQHMVGIVLGNQPIEEISFFIVVPFFGIILWEMAGKLDALRAKKHMKRGKTND